MSLTTPPEVLAARRERAERSLFETGRAHAALVKRAARPVAAPVLTGRLYLSKSGWLLCSAPNALVRGLFDAMSEPGVELPLKDGKLNAHISVLTDAETAKIGVDRITERGHQVSFQLGPIKSVEPGGWDGVSRVWFVSLTPASPVSATYLAPVSPVSAP